jgi:hypothetical protein
MSKRAITTGSGLAILVGGVTMTSGGTDVPGFVAASIGACGAGIAVGPRSGALMTLALILPGLLVGIAGTGEETTTDALLLDVPALACIVAAALAAGVAAALFRRLRPRRHCGVPGPHHPRRTR